MKIKKYDIFGNPINELEPSDELDPFLENFNASKHVPEKPSLPIKEIPTPKKAEPPVEETKLQKEERYARQRASLREEHLLKKAARQEKFKVENALHRTPEEYNIQRKASSLISKAAKKLPKSKIALAALTGGASLAAQAAEEGFDAESTNEGENEQLRQMQLERLRGENIAKNPKMRDMYDRADEELRTYGVEDTLQPISNKPQFRKLRKDLR
jgi:hypothetical protein